MLGSAKINGMPGHIAIYGDWFTTVQGAKALYYPMTPPKNDKLSDRHRPTPHAYQWFEVSIILSFQGTWIQMYVFRLI